MSSIDWLELLSSTTNRQQYTQQLEGLEQEKEEAFAAWLITLQLVSYLREQARLSSTSKESTGEETETGDEDKGNQVVPERGIAKEEGFNTPWSTMREKLKHLYLTPEGPLLKLAPQILKLLQPLSFTPSSATFNEFNRLLLLGTLQAGLEYLEALPISSLSTTATPLEDQINMLLSHDRLSSFPSPPSRFASDTILMSSSQADSNQSIASILLSHYVWPSSPKSGQQFEQKPLEESSEDEEDTRSIHTGIKEARASIIRKDDKLKWLLGEGFQQGPNGKSSQGSTTSSTGSTKSASTIRRPPTASPTVSRAANESTSTLSALPSFPSHSLAEQRDSVDSYTTPSIDSHSSPHRHSRLISTSSSTAPLLHSARPSASSTTRTPPPAIHLPPSPHRRVLSTGVIPSNSPYSFLPLSPALPTPPLQPLDSPSRPFTYLQDLPSPNSNSKRNSLDSAKDDLAHGRRESIPLNCHELTEREKSELVKRSKKLERLLGSRVGVKGDRRRGIEEEESEAGGRERKLRPKSIDLSLLVQSVPRAPISPTTIINDLSPTSSSIPTTPSSTLSPTRAPIMRRSSSSPSPMVSPLHSPTTTTPPSQPELYLTRSNSSSNPSTKTRRLSRSGPDSRAKEKERDERRKKLEKVRRVLGERVPLGLVVHEKPQLYEDEASSGTVGMGKSKSRQMGERIKEVFGGGNPGKAEEKRARKDRDRENWVGTQSAPQMGESERKRQGEVKWEASGKGGRQGVDALTKARKLESLFGDLPPQSLYLAPSPSSTSTSRPRHTLMHRRSHSDIGASRSTSISTLSSSYATFQQDVDLNLHRTRSNSSSVQSYRRSIASLRYVMESDPTALDEVVRVYSQRSSEDLPSSHAASVRKAQKLSSFFGTTKGEVWKRLLDDIGVAVEEDEALEDEERKEVLESLERLREGAKDQPEVTV